MTVKKPRKPATPKAPAAPKEVLTTSSLITYNERGGQFNLKELLPDGVSLDKITLSIQHDKDFYRNSCHGVYSSLTYEIPNPNLERDQKKYEDKMAEYDIKMLIHEEKLKEYEYRLAEWKASVAPQLLSDAQKRRDRLQKELVAVQERIKNLK
jgi:hypothetical protein